MLLEYHPLNCEGQCYIIYDGGKSSHALSIQNVGQLSGKYQEVNDAKMRNAEINDC